MIKNTLKNRIKNKCEGPAQISFVLVRSRNPGNIGAAARVLANFGFSDLRIVGSHPPIIKEAKAAVGAESLLKAASVFNDLAEATADCDWVVGTSAGKSRAQDQKWIYPQEFLEQMNSAKRPAVIFGSEKTGLTKSELNFCHSILTIPTSPSTPSMNLAQAVAVTVFALSGVIHKRPNAKKINRPKLENVNRLVTQGAAAIKAAQIFPQWPEGDVENRLRSRLTAWHLESKDIALLHGLFRAVVKNASS